MSFFGLGADNSTLQRLDSLANDAGGKIRWVQNKGTDQSGHTDTDNVDGTGHWEIRAYAGNDCDAYVPYHLTFDGDEETNPKAISWTDAANDNYRRLVVPQEDVASGAWGWFAFAGTCKCMVDGTADIAQDDYLFLDTDGAGGVVALITSGGVVETNSTVAIACEAQTSATDTAIRVYLIGAAKICDTQ